jgi:hypothetical protein
MYKRYLYDVIPNKENIKNLFRGDSIQFICF